MIPTHPTECLRIACHPTPKNYSDLLQGPGKCFEPQERKKKKTHKASLKVHAGTLGVGLFKLFSQARLNGAEELTRTKSPRELTRTGTEHRSAIFLARS
jgi:hypothetical protein